MQKEDKKYLILVKQFGKSDAATKNENIFEIGSFIKKILQRRTKFLTNIS